MLILYLFDKAQNRFTGILSVYGRVPLFYFTIHLYMIHTMMLIMLFIQGFKGSDLLFGPFKNGRPGTGGGVNLAMIYLLWICVVIALYPLCKWYGKYKADHPGNRFLRFL
jgi:hypothetical protein